MIEKLMLPSFLFFLLGNPVYGMEEFRFNNFEFSKGYAVIEGNPTYQGLILDEESIIYCEDYCVISDQKKTLTVEFRGFGRIRELKKFHPLVTKKIGSEVSEKEEKSKEPAKEKIQTLKVEVESTNLFPIPKVGSFILHQKGGRLTIIPKEKCINNCSLTILSKERQSILKKFKAGQQANFAWTFKANYQDSVEWILVDGDLTLKGSFEIRRHSTKAIETALSAGKALEFLN